MKSQAIWCALFVACLIPRAIGGAVNREANDDHIEVVQLWLENGAYPHENECWECFQPPLYSVLQYSIAFPLALHERVHLTWVAHGINFLLSIVILFVFYRLAVASGLRAHWQMLLFMFFGLNPKLIAINIQATNDTLLIAIGVLILYFLESLLRTFRNSTLVVLWVLALLAAITKGNGLVLLVGVCVVVTVAVVYQTCLGLREKAIILLLFLVSLPALSSQLGFYWDHYLDNGTPFSINQAKAPKPQLVSFDGYQGKRMGVRSITDCFLTFRFIDLLRHPYMEESGQDDYPVHRTSFFTQLYGQSFHAQFERYPWRVESELLNNLVRGLYLLGVVPLLLLVRGIDIQLRRSRQRFLDEGVVGFCQESLYLIFFVLFMVFLIKYSIDYRDFATMKLIFIFPVISAFFSFVAIAIKSLPNSRIETAAYCLMSVMCAGFVVNVAFLLMTICGT